MLLQNNSVIIDFAHIINRVKVSSSDHYHSYYELIYVKKGSFEIFIEDTIYTVSDGNVVLIPKNIIHKARFNEDGSSYYYLIHFFEELQSKDFLQLLNLLSTQRYILLNKEEQANVLFPLTRLYEEYRRNDKYSALLINAYLCELIVAIARSSCNNPVVRNKSVMEVATEFINKQIAEQNETQLTLSKLSELFSLNPSYFSKKFKKEIGIGFKEYLITVRIQHAKTLLKTTKKSVTEIAYICGFEDSNYFSTLFKRKEGVSPTEYVKTFCVKGNK